LRTEVIATVVEFHDQWKENTEFEVLAALDAIQALSNCVREPEDTDPSDAA
jgi:hypothetical protein